MAPAGCFCDGPCTGFGDCCGDFAETCLDWPKTWADTGDDGAHGLDTDGASNVYVAASAATPWDFGSGAVASTTNDLVIHSWDALGAGRWSTHVSAGPGGYVRGVGLVEHAGNVYVAGEYEGKPGIDGTAALPYRVGASYGFVIALSSTTGGFLWGTPSPEPSRFQDVIADANGVFVAGSVSPSAGRVFEFSHSGSVDVLGSGHPFPYRELASAPGGGFYVNVGAGHGVWWLMHLTEAGVPALTFTHGAHGIAHDIAAASGGSYFVVGICSDECDLGGPEQTPGSTFGAIARYDAAGAFLFQRLFSHGEDHVVFRRAEVTSGGFLHVAGTYEGAFDVGCGTLGAGGDHGSFVAQFSSSLACLAASVVTRSAIPASPHDLFLAADAPLKFLAGGFNGFTHISGEPFLTKGDSDGFVALVP